MKKAQAQPPVNANAELTLRKKLNAAKKKRKMVKEQQHPKRMSRMSMMRKHLNKMMMLMMMEEDKVGSKHHPSSRLVVAIKKRKAPMQARKCRRIFLTWQPLKKIAYQRRRNHRKKRKMPQGCAAT